MISLYPWIEIFQIQKQHHRSHNTGRWNYLYRSALLALLRELCRIRRVIFFQVLLLSSDKVSSILQHRLLRLFCSLLFLFLTQFLISFHKFCNTGSFAFIGFTAFCKSVCLHDSSIIILMCFD